MLDAEKVLPLIDAHGAAKAQRDADLKRMAPLIEALQQIQDRRDLSWPEYGEKYHLDQKQPWTWLNASEIAEDALAALGVEVKP